MLLLAIIYGSLADLMNIIACFSYRMHMYVTFPSVLAAVTCVWA